ncbi:MAG: hypothetical protein EBU85_04765 [Actinobacteria bacterium]|nr:hypothetical protein [Actinomycetota bacterium]
MTTEINATAWVDCKAAALRAHATQVQVQGSWYALSDGIGAALRGVEWFTCEVGIPERGADGRETDFFAGLGL